MRVLAITAVVVLLDQITKVLVKGLTIPFLNLRYEGMYYGEKIPVIDGILNITFIENPGIAFGIDFGADYKLLLTLFTFAASAGLFFYLYLIRDQHISIRAAIALILGGAIGNLIDRTFYGVFYDYAPLFYGKVVDFMDLHFLEFQLFNRTFGSYIFNLADVAVTAGVILILFAYNKLYKETEQSETALETSLIENKD